MTLLHYARHEYSQKNLDDGKSVFLDGQDAIACQELVQKALKHGDKRQNLNYPGEEQRVLKFTEQVGWQMRSRSGRYEQVPLYRILAFVKPDGTVGGYPK